MKIRITLVLLFCLSVCLAGEPFSPKGYGFQITFPNQFETEDFSDEVSNTSSATCTHAGMIFIVNAIKFKEDFTDDERSEQEAGSTVNICAALGSKWKIKKITSWAVNDESGYICPIKGKKKNGDQKVTFYGNFYVIMVGQIQYQLTVLSPKRKGFDGALERGFSNSFRLL